MTRPNENNPFYKFDLLKKILILTLFCVLIISNVLIGITTAADGVCVTSDPADVRYLIDGVYVRNTTSNEDCITDVLSPMKMHKITYEKEGYESYSTDQFVAYGVYRIHHRMRPLLIPALIDPAEKGDIEFYSPLNDVNIFLNGNKIRNTNTEDRFETNDLDAGTYLIEAKRRGYFDWSKSITVLAGRTTTVTIDLKIKNSLISINSTPSNLDIYIDDAFIGKTPLNTEILSGVHKLKIQAPLAFEIYEKTLEIDVEKKEISIVLTPSAELLIPEAEKLIDLNRRFKPVDAEYELIKAKNSFSNQDYVPALESAKNASKWAKDVDGDGVANEWDMFPNLANDIIYEIPLVIILIIGIVVLIDKHFCKANPHLEINIIEDPFEKRKFKLQLSIHLDRKIKSMSCSILLNNNSIEVLDAPGDYIIELGQLKRGTHEVSVDLSIIQKRYGKVTLNKVQEIDTDKRWFKKE